jgi:hypothetical protein
MNTSPLSALEIEALTFIYDVPAQRAAKRSRRNWTVGTGAGKAVLGLTSVALTALAWVAGRTGGA